MPSSTGVCGCQPPLAMCRVPTPGVADRRDSSSQHEDAADPMVLDAMESRRVIAATRNMTTIASFAVPFVTESAPRPEWFDDADHSCPFQDVARLGPRRNRGRLGDERLDFLDAGDFQRLSNDRGLGGAVTRVTRGSGCHLNVTRTCLETGDLRGGTRRSRIDVPGRGCARIIFLSHVRRSRRHRHRPTTGHDPSRPAVDPKRRHAVNVSTRVAREQREKAHPHDDRAHP